METEAGEISGFLFLGNKKKVLPGLNDSLRCWVCVEYRNEQGQLVNPKEVM